MRRPVGRALAPSHGLLLVVAIGCSACGDGSSPHAPTAPATPPAVAASSDWPMYGHDTGRTNYNAGERTIGSANVSLLAPRFQALIGSSGFPSSSSPVVAGGRVYVGSSVAEGDNYHCFDAATGTPLWSANLGHAVFNGNVGIGSTAAVVDGVVYVGGGDAAYYALDAQTGRVLWRHPMGIADDAFAWSSPLVFNGLVYVGMSARYLILRSELRALDVADGSVRARRHLVPEGQKGADVWNSPAGGPDGRLVVIATGNDFRHDQPYSRAMVALEATSLEILDARQEALPNEDLDFGTTPIVFRDASGRTLVGANQKNGQFLAYDLSGIGRGAVWQRATGVAIGAMPAYAPDVGPGGTLFIAGDNGLLFGVDPATGADRWPPVAVGYPNGNLAVANGLVYMGAGNGVVAIVAAESGTLLRLLEPPTPGRTFAGVSVAGGVVYATSGAYLNAWSAPAGATSPLPTRGSKAALEVSIEPGPVRRGPAEWRVVIHETAGVGGAVQFVNAKLRDAVSGAAATPTAGLSLDAADVAARAGTNRIQAGGHLSLDESLDYGFVSGRREADLSVAVQFVDDHGNFVTGTAAARLR